MKKVFTNLCLFNRVFFLFFETLFFFAMVHTEATLKGLNKPDLIKLVLQLESEMNSDIKEPTSETRDLVTQIKNVEAAVAIIFKNVNEKLVNLLIETEQ